MAESCCDSARVVSPDYICEPEWWVGIEAISWWAGSSSIPPLLATSPVGTAPNEIGRLDVPATAVVIGGSVFDDASTGFRFRAGRDFEGFGGLDVEVLKLATTSESFLFSSDGDPLLGRPFVDAVTGLPSAQLLAAPGLASGSFRVEMDSKLYGAAIHLFQSAMDDRGVATNGTDMVSAKLQIGPRFYSLEENLYAQETVNDNAVPQQKILTDTFAVDNTFWGGEVGLEVERRWHHFFWQGGLRLAIGATHQDLSVAGQTTTIDSMGGASTLAGGLLAQRTNSGSVSRNRLSFLPQLELGVGLRTRTGWEISVGYDLMIWSNVMRVADQIDTTINPNLLPPEAIPFSGPSRPGRTLVEDNYLAHGISIGIEKRW